MSDVTEDEARRRRVRHPAALAVAIGCYVLGAIAGFFLLADDVGFALLAPLWIVHGVLLVLLIRRLGARESSAYATLFILATSLMSVYVADMARDDLTLQQRGETVTATVTKKWRDPAEGRKARFYHYELKLWDGTKVPGPPMQSLDRYDVGATLTVVEDPEGALAPKTPADADATGDALGSAAFALAALASVGWMTWRGSDTARRRDAARKGPGGLRKAYKTVSGNHSTPEEQEEKLRAALREYSATPDRRGYVKVHPEDYPDVTQQRAARIAWELGLRAEAAGNRGAWRFGETVVEEVPRD